MTDHILTKRKLKEVADVSDFDSLLEHCTITDEDREILRMHYLKGKSFQFIADILGYSEVTVRKHHAKALKKIAKLF